MWQSKLPQGDQHYKMSQVIEILKILRIIAHPDFDSWTISADYALLRLQQPVNFDKYHHIRPVCLPQGPPPVTGDMV